MANISHGMNVEEVRRLGQTLQKMSNDINALAQQLNTAVNNTSWVGPDATTFKNNWWPGHRAHLQQLSSDLHGFGQSAINNASEQENVSGH